MAKPTVLNSATQTVDPQFCPRCAKANHCAMASNPQAGSCWCQRQIMPAELTEQLNAATAVACLCQSCAAKAQTQAHSQVKTQAYNNSGNANES